jgi:hypothetical protein
VGGLHCNSDLLRPLTRLGSLRTLLGFNHAHNTRMAAEDLQVVSQLTGLECLQLYTPDDFEGLLLQLTHLQQVTSLEYSGRVPGPRHASFNFTAEVGCMSGLNRSASVCLP